MCGIAGYVATAPLDGPGMVESLAHRGPDSRGTYEAAFGERRVFLGHTRLRILDLSDAGRQPMRSAAAPVTVVYNGEVYNFQALRERLLPGHAFRSKTDTEVLLELYVRLGPRFVEHLNGDFAFALLDERTGRLLLYRDRMGVKPLYYYRDAGTFAFASEIKAIRALGLPTTLSEESLHRYLAFKYVPGDDTLYAQVRRLPPGSYAVLDLASGRFDVRRYWSAMDAAGPPPKSYRAAQDELRELLGDAVRLRLVSDVPVGTFLSGGVDSSAVASFVRDRKDVVHYCARKTERDLRVEGTTSDYHYARRLAADWSLDLRAADIGADEATLEQIRRTLYFSDDLIADGSQIPSYLIAEEAGRSVRVMLSGMGADEIFLGYAGHQLALMASYFDRLPGPLARGAARLLGNLDQGRGALKAYRRHLQKFGRFYLEPGHRYAAFSVVGDLDRSLGVCRRAPDAVLAYLEGYFPPGADPFDALLQFETENFLVKNLHYFDRMCMAHAVEGRVPFMDHRLVAWAAGLPRSYKMSARGRGKRVLKDALRGLVPRYVLARRKAGFGMPLRSLFQSPGAAERLLDLDFLGGFGFFDVDHVRALLGAHREGAEDNAAILYALVSFQEWYRLFHAEEVPA